MNLNDIFRFILLEFNTIQFIPGWKNEVPEEGSEGYHPFIPAMELICDPVGMPENIINIPAVFPNPASNMLSVTNVRDAKIELFDPNGKLILSDEQITSTRTLDVSGYRSGIYFLLITTNQRCIGKKVVITAPNGAEYINDGVNDWVKTFGLSVRYLRD